MILHLILCLTLGLRMHVAASGEQMLPKSPLPGNFPMSSEAQFVCTPLNERAILPVLNFTARDILEAFSRLAQQDGNYNAQIGKLWVSLAGAYSESDTVASAWPESEDASCQFPETKEAFNRFHMVSMRWDYLHR
jgi:hypothetical protein